MISASIISPIDPDMPLDEMNRLFASIAEDYGGLYFDYDGENCYGWDMVPHIYHSPLYYISYGTSAFPALRLWIDHCAVNRGLLVFRRGLRGAL